MMNYHNIKTDDMLNGDGMRVVLYVAGCDFNCINCHNPITHDHAGGLKFETCNIDELSVELNKDHISGITFTGGDPLSLQNREYISYISNILKDKHPEKTQWLYTGYLWENIRQLYIMQNLQVVVDGQFIDSLKDTRLRWKGSKNQRVIDIQKSLKTEVLADPIIWCEEYTIFTLD